MLVYLATNNINGKQYVGYTTLDLESRIKTHVYKSRSKNNYFYLFKNALRKYGAECFSWSILEYCTSTTECCEKEIYYINKLNTISPYGYNLTHGGNGGIQSDDTKFKISNSLKEYYSNNKHPIYDLSKDERQERTKKAWITKKKKGFKTRKGVKHSTESCSRMSETKNKKNAVYWFNIITKEEVFLSATDMAKYTGLSVSLFSHLKTGRLSQTKNGWIKR